MNLLEGGMSVGDCPVFLVNSEQGLERIVLC